MQIYLASDHAGFYLKEKLKADLLARGFLVQDFGAMNFEQSDDYPDFIFPCIKQMVKETGGNPGKGLAIIFGGSGTGEAIVANRVRGGRAVVFNHDNFEIVRLGRGHNNANVLSIGARFVSEKECLEAVKIFMTTTFEAGHHAKRVLKLDMIQ